MDEELAERIRVLRMELGYTWRSIALEITGRDNQRVGRELCFEAEEVLGLSFDDNQEV